VGTDPSFQGFGKGHPNFFITESPSFKMEDGVRRIFGYLL
jgi:hypothetical protein